MVERAEALMTEFRRHYREYVRQHPGSAGKKRAIFQGWAIQKIAGLQLCIEHIAENFNRHLQEDGSPSD